MAKKQENADYKEPNSYELTGIEFLAALDNQLAASEKHLESRLHSVPDGWRQYRIAQTAIRKVVEGVYATLPEKTLRHMMIVTRNGEAIIRQRSFTKTNDAQLVPEDVLRMLINTTMSAQCAICLKDGKEAKRCKLRKALMLIAPPDVVNEDGCSYSDVALQNEPGNYI